MIPIVSVELRVMIYDRSKVSCKVFYFRLLKFNQIFNIQRSELNIMIILNKYFNIFYLLATIFLV